MIRLLLLFSLFLLSACNMELPSILPPPTPTPFIGTIIHDSGLERVDSGDFTRGKAAIPEGRYLILLFSPIFSCAAACDCPAVEPPSPAFDFNDDTLTILSDRTDQSWIQHGIPDSVRGFLGVGQYYEELLVLEELPFTHPASEITLQSVDHSGAIVVTLQNTLYRLSAGQSWQSLSTWAGEQPDCIYSMTRTLTNVGFIPSEQIEIYGTPTE